MVSLQRPFYHHSSFELADIICNETHKPLNSGVDWIDSMIDSMLRKNPKDRPSILDVVHLFDINTSFKFYYDNCKQISQLNDQDNINNKINTANNKPIKNLKDISNNFIDKQIENWREKSNIRSSKNFNEMKDKSTFKPVKISDDKANIIKNIRGNVSNTRQLKIVNMYLNSPTNRPIYKKCADEELIANDAINSNTYKKSNQKALPL
jgi:hypothetical protein